ncbi:hypothetical protein LZC95_44505 [Pendulispora brunnea]|uniref:Uncharacterized protein n=1 Tax=Pendulispora brunnea TaxID=2905690 RepID=A0ABZ2K886_9BACT
MKRGTLVPLVLLVLPLVACLAACRSNPTTEPRDPPDTPASPQANAVPAPLAVAPTASASAASSLDAGPPAQPLRPDQPMTADSLPTRDSSGYTMAATLHAELPPLPRGPEYAAAAVETARKKTEPRLTLDLGSSRLRMSIASHGFVLPMGTELRARVDRYGHVVLTPDGASYRIASPGALHALLGERRFDVAPLSPADVNGTGEGARRLGYRTRKVDVVNRAAHATFEIARVADAGDSGILVCRALLDMMNAPPSTPLCSLDEVPMFAELRWTTRGALVFTATTIVRRLDLSATALLMPPPTATFVTSPLPGQGSEILLTGPELHALRTGEHPPEGRPALTLFNSSDVLQFAWLDGIPIAWVAPGGRVEIPALAKGRGSVEWRTYLGDVVDPARPVTLPGLSEPGGTDASVP